MSIGILHTRNPIINRLVVFFCVLDIFVYLGSIVGFRGLVPGTHVNTDGKAIREELLCGLDIDVLRNSWRRRMEMGVMRGQLTTEGCHVQTVRPLHNVEAEKERRPTIHSPRNLTSLLVAPTDRRKVCFVVQKATVKEWLNIGVGGLDMDLSTARRVFLNIETSSKHHLS